MPGDRTDRIIVPGPAESLSGEGLVEELLPGSSTKLATGQGLYIEEAEMEVGDDNYTMPPDKSFTPVHSVKRKAEVSPEVAPPVIDDEDDSPLRPSGIHKRYSRLHSSSDDSDDPDVTFTGQSLVDKVEASRMRVLRRKKGVPDESPSTSKNKDGIIVVDQRLEDKSMTDLKNIGMSFLDEIEGARSRSSNIKGNLSGLIKSNVIKMRDLIEIFSARLEARSDLSHMRQVNNNMAKELAETKMESIELKKDIKEMRSQMDNMSATIRNLQAIIERSEKFSSRVEGRIDLAYNKMVSRESHSSKVNTPSSIEDREFLMD